MQPQQQTVVTSAVPVQPVYISQPYQAASVVNSYRRRQSTVIGILLIIAGCLSIILNIVDLAIGTQDKYTTYNIFGWEHTLSHDSNGVVGHGFWCGVFVIIAGGFAIGAARHKTRCMINTFMVFAIIGAVFAAIQLIVAGDGAGKLDSGVYGGYLSSSCSSAYSSCNEVKTVYAMEILLALLGVGAFGLCVWGSILCCVTGGCCAPTPTTFIAMPAGQPQVTVVTQQQQQQQQPVAMAHFQTYPPQQVVYPPQYPQPPTYLPQQVVYPPQYTQHPTYPPQPGYPGEHAPK